MSKVDISTSRIAGNAETYRVTDNAETSREIVEVKSGSNWPFWIFLGACILILIIMFLLLRFYRFTPVAGSEFVPAFPNPPPPPGSVNIILAGNTTLGIGLQNNQVVLTTSPLAFTLTRLDEANFFVIQTQDGRYLLTVEGSNNVEIQALNGRTPTQFYIRGQKIILAGSVRAGLGALNSTAGSAINIVDVTTAGSSDWTLPAAS